MSVLQATTGDRGVLRDLQLQWCFNRLRKKAIRNYSRRPIVMRIHLPEAIWFLLLLAKLDDGQDYERAVRALRPVDLKPQETAVLDSLEH